MNLNNNGMSAESTQEFEYEEYFNIPYENQAKKVNQFYNNQQQQQEKQEYKQYLFNLYQEIINLALEGEKAKNKYEISQDKLKKINDKYPEFSRINLRTNIKNMIIFLAFPAIYLINLVLIYRPVEYLATSAFDKGSFVVNFAIIFLPLALQIFEVAIGTHLKSTIQREGKKNVQKNAQKKPIS